MRKTGNDRIDGGGSLSGGPGEDLLYGGTGDAYQSSCGHDIRSSTAR